MYHIEDFQGTQVNKKDAEQIHKMHFIQRCKVYLSIAFHFIVFITFSAKEAGCK